MSFTNQMLGALGTATGALAAGQHIAEQKKANEAAEAQKEVQIKDLEYANKKDEVELKEKLLVHNTFPIKNQSKSFFSKMKSRAESNAQWVNYGENFANGIIFDTNQYLDEDDDDEENDDEDDDI